MRSIKFTLVGAKLDAIINECTMERHPHSDEIY